MIDHPSVTTSMHQVQTGKARGVEAWFFAAAVLVVIAFKVLVLAHFVDDRLGDYGRLERFADAILQLSSWLHDAGIDREALPPELWKTPGYPLLIAAAKLAFGESWPIALMILTSALSLVAGLFVRRLALAFGLGSILATVAFVLFEFSVPASTDVLLMPDGLYGSLGTIVMCIVGVRIVRDGDVSIASMALAGGIIGLCFFVREGFVYLVVPFGLAFTVPLWLAGQSVRRAAVLLVVFCLPTILATAGILAWNRYRTGDYIVAVVSETVFLIAALKTAEKDPSVFAGSTDLDKAARASISDHDYGDAQEIVERLFKEYGIKAPEAYRLARAKFIDAIIHHPRAYVSSLLDRFRFAQQASMTGDVLMRLDDLEYWRFVIYHTDYHGGWRAQARELLRTRELGLLTSELLAKIAPRVVTRAASIVLFLLFVVGLPLLIVLDLKNGRNRRAAVFLASLYALYWAIFGIHLLVGVEIRYLGAICAIPIIGSLVVLMRMPRPRRA